MLQLIRSCILILSLFSVFSVSWAMTMEEIKSLIKAGVSEEVILFKIRQTPGGMYLSPEDMLALREAGASDKFLLEILKTEEGEATLITPDQAAKIAAAPDSATLIVVTKPTGANIVIDGVPVGKSPYLGNQLEMGSHEIYISKRFYRSVVRPIVAKVGEKIEITEVLQLELPGVAVDLKTKGFSKESRWAISGLAQCRSKPFAYVSREPGKEDGKVVLRAVPSTDGTPVHYRALTCLEVFFWEKAPNSAENALKPDVIFKIEDIPFSSETLSLLSLLVERTHKTSTGYQCSIVDGQGRLEREAGKVPD